MKRSPQSLKKQGNPCLGTSRFPLFLLVLERFKGTLNEETMQHLRVTLIAAIAAVSAFSTQSFSQIRVMCYNTAQFNGDPSAMASVLTEASLDDSHGFATPVSIFLFQEVDEEELSILEKVVGPEYTRATFTDQNDSSWGGAQAMFYLSTQFVEHASSHRDIYTYASRHADRWGLDVIGYNERLYVYSMHLKASTGSTNQETRRAGAENVRDDIMTLPSGAKFIVAGDMNFYSPSEPGYEWFTAEGDGQVIDPLGNGAWSSGTHALKHTQSPLASQNGGLIGGGLDDRFDFQFLSENLIDGGGFDIIDGTYRSFGNDGQHYNDAINDGNNFYFPGDTPRGNMLADLLVEASDHIPVIVDYMVPAKMDWAVSGGGRVIVGADASLSIDIENTAPVTVSDGADVLSVDVELTGDIQLSESLQVEALAPETVQVPIDTSVPHQWNAAIELSPSSLDMDTTPVVSKLNGSVLRHANPSFAFNQDIDWFVHEVSFEKDSGVQSFNVWLFNYAFNGEQSLLDIDNVTTPQPPIMFEGLSTDVVGSIPVLMEFHINTDSVDTGTYEQMLPVSVSDEDLPGETSTISMLTVRVHVDESEACPADIAGENGVVDVNDLLMLIGDWGAADSPADITGPDGNPDGTVNVADLLELIANWGPCF